MRRDRDDGDLAAELANNVGQCSRGLDDDIANLRANFGRIVVENADDAEATVEKTVVACQRVAQITCTHQHNRPYTVNLEDLLKLAAKKGHVVASALFAELAEMAEVFANLCRTDAEQPTQFLAGGHLGTLAVEQAQRAQVDWQAADHDIGNLFKSRVWLVDSSLGCHGIIRLSPVLSAIRLPCDQGLGESGWCFG